MIFKLPIDTSDFSITTGLHSIKTRPRRCVVLIAWSPAPGVAFSSVGAKGCSSDDLCPPCPPCPPCLRPQPFSGCFHPGREIARFNVTWKKISAQVAAFLSSFLYSWNSSWSVLNVLSIQFDMAILPYSAHYPSLLYPSISKHIQALCWSFSSLSCFTFSPPACKGLWNIWELFYGDYRDRISLWIKTLVPSWEFWMQQSPRMLIPNIWKIIPFDPFHPLPGSSSVPPKNHQSLSIYSPASLCHMKNPPFLHRCFRFP